MLKHKVLNLNVLLSLFLIQISAIDSPGELQLCEPAVLIGVAAGTPIPTQTSFRKMATRPRCLRLRSLFSCMPTRVARNNQTPQVILVPVSIHSHGQDEPTCHCKCDYTHVDCGNCDCECGDCGDGNQFDSYDND